MKSVVGELCAVLDEKELDRPETPVSIHSSNIVLENVSFSYESEKPLLKISTFLFQKTALPLLSVPVAAASLPLRS